ncbi:MAG: PIN domain-containing protein [Burkholderiales bacterium]|jgi:tRNA(fMet)-specific endonuclease VapC
MATTRLFRNGNSQAVRIPAELAYPSSELEAGVASTERERRTRVRRALARFVEEVPVVPFDAAAAAAYGPVRLASRDRRRDALDRMIAAHALALDVALVTSNVADFAGCSGLRIENWVEPDAPA